MIVWARVFAAVLNPYVQGGSNMTGTNCDLITHKTVPVVFEPPCIIVLRFSFHDLTCLADVSVLRPDSRSDGRSVRTQNPEHGPPSSRINLKLDGWAWLLVLSPPSVSHFYSSFSWLFHICAARYMWLHCWPPTSTIQLMYRYCGFTAFAYAIKSLVPIVQNISFRLVLELSFLQFAP
jgi:hypothetical protein